MAKQFTVYVRGELDWEYEIEAEDKYDAMDQAESQFAKDFHVMWSGITSEAEEDEDDES